MLYVVKDTVLDITNNEVKVWYIAPSDHVTASKDVAKRYISKQAAMKALKKDAMYFKQAFESDQEKVKFVAVETDRWIHTYTLEGVDIQRGVQR